eukprot:6913360-Alexandrium_andersonii.AAC.1
MAGRGSWVISKEDRRSAVQYRILLPYIRVGTGWKCPWFDLSLLSRELTEPDAKIMNGVAYHLCPKR